MAVTEKQAYRNARQLEARADAIAHGPYCRQGTERLAGFREVLELRQRALEIREDIRYGDYRGR